MVRTSNQTDAAAPAVLELRVHGINNTKPHDLLDLPADEVEFAAGDKLGFFFRPTAAALKRRVTEPDAVTDRGDIPRGVRREAYSWGGMVRGTPTVGGLGGVVLAGLARAGWALLLPFSLANAAIWTWQLPNGGAPARLSGRAAVIRAFGVLLTLLLVGAVGTLALDVVALQCYRDGVLVCTVLSDGLAPFGTWLPGRRLALFSLVPLVTVGALWALSAASRLRYDVAEQFIDPDALAVRHDDTPLLGRPGFWQRSGDTNKLALAHLAAGISATSLALFTAIWAGGSVFGLVGFAASVTLLLLAIGTAAVTKTMPFEHGPASRNAAATRRPRWSVALTVACGILWLVALVALAVGVPAARPQPLRIAGVNLWAADVAQLTVVGAAMLLVVAAAFFPLRGARRYRAWHGFAPVIFLGFSLTAGLIWSALVTVGIGDWLNGGAGASTLAPGIRPPVPQASPGDGSALADPDLDVPAFHSAFGLLSFALLLVVAALLTVVLARRRSLDARLAQWLRRTLLGPLGRPGTPGDAPMRPGTPEELAVLLQPAILGKRDRAARLHLAEPVTGILAGSGLIAATLALTLPWLLPAPAARFLTPFLDVTMTGWALIAALTVAGLVLGSGTQRPLATVWDLACFLPRSGHPLGPPCYTERAAPEVARRVLWWLQAERAGSRPEQRRVVLAAHSMGAVVCTAALFLLSSHEDREITRQRVSLLTFGVQLRPYFGRFFPELLGPDVLGTTPCERPRLLARDPWAADAAKSVAPGTGAMPVDRWISLWRATDYLGFPAHSNRAEQNPIDRYTEEFDGSGYTASVGTHGEYYRARDYNPALCDLAGIPVRR
ncbi:hypothetical protein [Salinibacterium sp. ZJ450]|uniref:hypothetical protein n=1 Tax=Salinibacterium sp. ZJ450 TaxID=2708338 RepID=UPI0014244B55|nr:hypothetical protein [Salinibacterium sp. ZJ450]